MAVSGVRSSWDTLATNSVRTCSSRRSSVTSWSTMTTPRSSPPRAQRQRRGPRARARPAPRGAPRAGARGRAPPPRLVPEHLVQLGVPDHLEERLALAAHRAEAEDGARPLVHQQDVLVAVDRDDALDHPVEDRGDLGLLLLEVLDLLAQPRGQDVERAARACRSRRASAIGARTRKLPSLIWRAIDCISTTGRSRGRPRRGRCRGRPAAPRAARQHHLVERRRTTR